MNFKAESEEVAYLPEKQTPWLNGKHAHLLMGWAFGANNLMYGLYLKLTSEPLDAE
jgi:hypothetical protein